MNRFILSANLCKFLCKLLHSKCGMCKLLFFCSCVVVVFFFLGVHKGHRN
jgi:hypothetical protein